MDKQLSIDANTAVFDMNSESSVNNWIQEIVKGKTFADLGGLWNTVNEKVSVAALAGASECTMMDISPPDSEWWAKYRERLEARGVSGTRDKTLNVMDLSEVEGTTPVDVLHCSGVIYHIPNYFEFMRNIWKLTNDYLILGSMVVPDVITNKAGMIDLSSASLLPHLGLSRAQKKVIEAHFDGAWGKEMKIVNSDEQLLIDPQSDDAFNDFGPWWWFFTAKHLYNLLIDFGYEIVDHKCIWHGKAYAFLCRKNRQSSFWH